MQRTPKADEVYEFIKQYLQHNQKYDLNQIPASIIKEHFGFSRERLRQIKRSLSDRKLISTAVSKNSTVWTLRK